MLEEAKKNLYKVYLIAEEFVNAKFPSVARKESEKCSVILEVMKMVIELKKLERIDLSIVSKR